MIETLFSSALPDVRITYQDATGNVTERTVSPVGVRRMKTGEPALIAYCRLRQAIRTFSVYRLCTLNGLSSEKLLDWMDQPLARYDMFESLKAGWGTAFTLPSSFVVLTDSLTPSLTEALIWWKGDTVRLDADTRTGTALRELSGHQAMEGMAKLAACAKLIHDSLGAPSEPGAVAVFRDDRFPSRLHARLCSNFSAMA